MKVHHPYTRYWQRFFRRKLCIAALFILGSVCLLSLFAELICNSHPIIVSYKSRLYFPAYFFYPDTTFGGSFPGEPNYKELKKNPSFIEEGGWMVFPPYRFGPNESVEDLVTAPPSPPSKQNFLGTDDRGRDLLARLIYGFRNSFLFAVVAWAAITFLGTLWGGVQAYLGGGWDFWGQRFVEIWSSLPLLYVIIFLLSLYPPSLFLLLVVWTLFGWVNLSQYVRAEVLKIRKLDYVTAIRALGGGRRRIFFRHILPNALTPVITFAPFILASSIGSLAALDYLGLGLPPPASSWGELIRQGKENLSSWWLSVFPVLSLFLTLLLLSFVGDGVREAFDSKAK